jgi:hypothetical protein
MQIPSLEKAQRILKDKRYSAAKRKQAREIIREAKGSSKPKSKKLTRRSKSKSSKRRKSSRTSKTSKTRSSKKRSRTRTKGRKSGRRIARRKKNPSRTARSRSSRSTRKLGGKRIRFYDPRTKKYVNIPRSACKLKRNKNPRGRDRVVATHKGKKFSTAVPKGFKL